MPQTTINVSELARLLDEEHIHLIDVRTPVEFRSVHVPGSKNTPLDVIDPHSIVDGLGDERIVLICKQGGRGEKARQKFVDAGFDCAVNVEGGTAAWAAADFPVVRGKQSISLERQVRILAGMIVLVSSMLAMVWNAGFAGIAAFVGAGLMFAGISDTCGMAIILAKMPWNQVKNETCQVVSSGRSA